MKIYRRSIHLLLIMTLVFMPMLSLVSPAASAADLPACHKDSQKNVAENSGDTSQMNHENGAMADHSDCNNQCGACFTCLKLPVSQVRLNGPDTAISSYVHTPVFSFSNISPQQEPRPPRLA
jgi:hypothetical protein